MLTSRAEKYGNSALSCKTRPVGRRDEIETQEKCSAIWTPYGISIERIYFDRIFWEDLARSLMEFHVSYIVLIPFKLTL
jgi:hypothetical protein